jgi:predicted membrane-bound spermidine synthase
MIALATLMYEILLTRIFSVTMWYHFAFAAISVAMFGMTVGALIVYLFPDYFTLDRAHFHLAGSSLLFALTIVVSFMTHLSIPFVAPKSLVAFYSAALNYLVISVPFVFSGICVCLGLTKFPRQINALYAADLAGAATGCILVVYALKITDGPSAVIAVASLATAGSALFAAGGSLRRLRRVGLLCGAFLAGAAVVNSYGATKHVPPLRLMWVKGVQETDALFEKWNTFSRIRVYGDPEKPKKPWGTSRTCAAETTARELNLTIDATADTPLTSFDGDLRRVEYLRCSATNVAHYLRPGSKVLVVGTGGGRDILSALVFDQQSVVGVELNQEIVSAVNQTFGDFTGHLDANPKVRFVADEARSYLARHNDLYDIIQISFVDTWAATAAGAFVLSENSLYTVEAWKLFLTRLRPGGVLTVSRWYLRDRPAEMYRLTSLAAASLREAGVDNPRNHLIIVRDLPEEHQGVVGIGTLLVGKDPFTEKDVVMVRTVAQDLAFDVVLSPDSSLDSTFAEVASGRNLDKLSANYPLRIAPPTDDSPFFFHMLRFRDMFNRELQKQGAFSANLQAVAILGGLLVTVCGLTTLCIVLPLALSADKTVLRGTLPLFIYFACIGTGFMLVEVSQMQRLIIFLGHPTYGLSVVLFALLLSSGLGSFSIGRAENPCVSRDISFRLILLLAMLVIFGILTPHLVRQFREGTSVVRTLVAAGILAPVGFFMGMAFPLGMQVASNRSASLLPWLWGINGATSVLASVVAVVIALSAGISTSFWVGCVAYAVGISVLILARQVRESVPA